MGSSFISSIFCLLKHIVLNVTLPYSVISFNWGNFITYNTYFLLMKVDVLSAVLLLFSYWCTIVQKCFILLYFSVSIMSALE